MRKFLALPSVAATGLVLGVSSAHAQTGLDTTSVTTAFADAASGVGAIAATMLAVVAAGIAVKWILGFLIS